MAPSAFAEWVWDTEVGWVDTAVAPAASAREIYAYARGLLVQGNYASARDVFQRVAREYPTSELTAKARFAEARCEAVLGNVTIAARLIEQLLAERPAGIDINELAAMQVELAERIIDAPESSQALATAAALAPSASLRMAAQLKLADKQFAQGRYQEAWEDYEFALSEAPDAANKAKAMFMSALSDMAVSRQDGHDMYRVQRARDRLKGVISFLGDSALLNRAQESLWLAESLLNEPDADRRAVYYDAALLQARDSADLSATPFRKAAKRFKGTTTGEAARFYQAECYFREDRVWKAFKTYERFVKEYPASRRMRSVIEREFLIGRRLEEEGERGKVEHVMSAVAHNNPIGPWADDAYMALGRANIARERFGEARDYFDLVVLEYPRSEWVQAAVYMGGVADLEHSDFANDRQRLLERARSSFELYLRNAPDGPFAADAQELLRDCREKQSRDMMTVAAFYERRKQPGAARVYYEEIVREFPATNAADTARTRLDSRGGGDGGS
jgi:outer membrane assembly lipoprotein YfiO